MKNSDSSSAHGCSLRGYKTIFFVLIAHGRYVSAFRALLMTQLCSISQGNMVVQELRKMAEDICVERWCIFISDDWKYVEAISSRVTSFAKNTGNGLYSYMIELSEETVAESSILGLLSKVFLFELCS